MPYCHCVAATASDAFFFHYFMSATATVSDPNRKHLETARTLIAKGDLKQAALTLNKAQRQAPNDPRVFMLVGLMAEKSGNIDGAFEALRRSVSLAPDWGPGLLELALLLARQNQFQEAIETAEKVAALEPSNLQVLAGVIDIAHRAGHTEMAIRHLRRGLGLVPHDPALRKLLARDLGSLGQHAEAIALWAELALDHPDDIEAQLGHIQACIAGGQPALATTNADRLLNMAPGNAVYSYYADLTHGKTPPHQPPAISQSLFDGVAEVYDQHMVRGLRYQLPKQIAEKIVTLYPDKKLNVLDLGCGTGLLGVCLGQLDGFLIGVEISRRMIEQATRHGVYARFHTVDLLDALRETPDATYEVITALDTFTYVGDLTQAVPNAYRILVPGGHLMFSGEIASEDGPDLVLQANNCYAHKRSHIEKLCKSAGFDVVEVQDTVLRFENNAPINGFVVIAHKPA